MGKTEADQHDQQAWWKKLKGWKAGRAVVIVGGLVPGVVFSENFFSVMKGFEEFYDKYFRTPTVHRQTTENSGRPTRGRPAVNPSTARNPVFGFSSCSAPFPWRHLRAPAGAAAPRSRIRYGGEDCLSAASSAALTLRGPGQRHPKGHARAPMVLGPLAETKGPRRAGTNPRKYKPVNVPL